MIRYLSICDGIGTIPLAWQPLGREVSAKGRESNRGRANPELPAQQTGVPPPNATAARSDSDDRSASSADRAGRKAGPKNKEVTR